jgi:hypothetical protein
MDLIIDFSGPQFHSCEERKELYSIDVNAIYKYKNTLVMLRWIHSQI